MADIPLPERNPLFHTTTEYHDLPTAYTMTEQGSSVGGVFDFLNNVATGIGQLGTNIYGSLAGIKQAEAQYKYAGKPAPVDRTGQYLMIGGGILLLVLLLKD